MAEWRMTDVVNQRQSLGQIRVQPQSPGDGARNLSHLNRMREPVAEVVRVASSEDLRFGFEAAESARMNHAVAVPRIIVAVAMFRFGPATPARLRHVHGERRKHHARHSMLVPHPNHSRRHQKFTWDKVKSGVTMAYPNAKLRFGWCGLSVLLTLL